MRGAVGLDHEVTDGEQEIGVNIVETAEFVAFRVAQWPGGRRMSE